MLLSASTVAITFASLVLAQAPPGFQPAVNNKLEVIFRSTMVNQAGQQIAKDAASAQPQLALSSAMMSKTDTYMFVMLDLDVPPAANSNQRRVLLHCMNTGFKASNQEIGGAATLLSSSDTGPAAYIPPNPPAVDTIAHRYVELLFQQPANFSIAQSTFAEMSARINFDTQAFMTQHGLKAPVAANFFLVDGRTNSTAAANPTGTGSGGSRPTSSLEPFSGAADRPSVSFGTAGQLVWLTLFALFAL
ncbi:26 kDa secreted antigen [Curvularia clavata]|uniref:26 kDa secreted antigen n=1 Tax=Curvularia clavata TaxID=95742 RepID=A0A9Q8YZG4_CURCL|nr:26 kDa secreted antigen [Curvularia clavata]